VSKLPFNPHQWQCTRCVMSGKNCDHLKFEEMKPVYTYGGVAIIVKCTEYKKRKFNER